MENDYCYDKEINSCWLGLCEDNFKYINSISSYSDYEESLKELRDFYKNYDIDIPTSDELKSLESKYLEKSLLFKDKNTIKSCNIVSFFNRIFTISSSIYPIYRLNTQKEKLSNREHFILWITNGLKLKV